MQGINSLLGRLLVIVRFSKEDAIQTIRSKWTLVFNQALIGQMVPAASLRSAISLTIGQFPHFLLCENPASAQGSKSSVGRTSDLYLILVKCRGNTRKLSRQWR